MSGNNQNLLGKRGFTEMINNNDSDNSIEELDSEINLSQINSPSSPYLNIQSPPLYQRGDETKSPDSVIIKEISAIIRSRVNIYERLSEYLVIIH